MSLPAVAALFDGFDSFNACRKDVAVTGAAGSPTDASIDATMYVCRDYAALQSALNIDASVSGSYGPVSASAKVSYMHNLQTTSTSVVVVIYAARGVVQAVTGTPAFTADAANMLSNDAVQKDFVAKYGDSYVSQIRQGAEYIGTIVFNSTTRDEQERIAAAVSGSYGSAGLQVSASVSTSLARATQASHVSYVVKQMITGYDSQLLPDVTGYQTPEGLQRAIDNMIQFASGLGHLPTPTAPSVISFATVPFEVFAPNQNFGHLAENRQIRVGLPPSQPGLDAQIAQLSNVNASCDQLRKIHQFYGVTPDQDLATRQQHVLADLGALKAVYQAMADAPTALAPKCTTALPSLSYGAPQLAFSTPTNAICGGINGRPFNDIGPADVSRPGRLTALTIRVGTLINGLDLTYSYGDGQPNLDCHYGEPLSQPRLQVPLQLAPDEFIVSFKAWIWNDITGPGDVHSIAIVTSKGTQANTRLARGESVDPDPIATGAVNYIDWRPQQNEVMIGLSGQWVGEGIKNVSVVSVIFEPVRWLT